MSYNNDLTWVDLSRQTTSITSSMIALLNQGLEAYNNWQSFRAGRIDADIATALARTAAEVADMDSAMAALKALHDFANNVAGPVAGDRFFSMRKF